MPYTIIINILWTLGKLGKYSSIFCCNVGLYTFSLELLNPARLLSDNSNHYLTLSVLKAFKGTVLWCQIGQNYYLYKLTIFFVHYW